MIQDRKEQQWDSAADHTTELDFQKSRNEKLIEFADEG